jgi:hypothetical protein
MLPIPGLSDALVLVVPVLLALVLVVPMLLPVLILVVRALLALMLRCCSVALNMRLTHPVRKSQTQ